MRQVKFREARDFLTKECQELLRDHVASVLESLDVSTPALEMWDLIPSLDSHCMSG